MSASLVGSEMCIRDRSPSWHPTWRAVRCLRSPRALAPAAYVGQYGPVSYTHLTLPTICSV
eukprot:6657681-Alexandrium_andersonii.AAC.1